jgi:hypothetical protein
MALHFENESGAYINPLVTFGDDRKTGQTKDRALTRLPLFGVEFADFRALVDSKFLIG